MQPFVSIIIPVYNDAGRIGRCIEALLGQSYSSYEIIVVDNGSTDDTCEIVSRFPAKLLIEDKIQNSYGARNLGVRSASGEVIAFTDSDCIPHPDWIEKGVAALLREPGCGLVGGRIKLFFKNPDRPTAVELYESKHILQQKANIEQHHFGSTANVFTFKKVISDVGLFDATLKSGGDNKWGRRVHACGYKLVYAENACVDHPARSSFRELYSRVTRLTGGNYDQRKSDLAFAIGQARGLRYAAGLIVRAILGKYPTESLHGARERSQYLLSVIFVNLISGYESFRLLLGGSSKRQ